MYFFLPYRINWIEDQRCFQLIVIGSCALHSAVGLIRFFRRVGSIRQYSEQNVPSICLCQSQRFGFGYCLGLGF